MPLTALYTYTAQTVTASEKDLTTNNTSIQSYSTAGFYTINVDVNAMTFAERYRLFIREKATTSSSQRVLEYFDLVGPFDKPIFTTPLFCLAQGWTFTMQRLAGTDRTFSWTIYQVT